MKYLVNYLRKKRFLLPLLALGILWILLSVVPLPDYRLNAPQSYRFYDRQGELLALLISEDGYFRIRGADDTISSFFIKALLLQEDRNFYDHHGISLGAMTRALWQNLKHGRVVSGGSTITMQLARMLQRRHRSFGNKLLEVFRTWQLERKYTKTEILTHYLTIAPYGGNIEGLPAAAYFYFGKSAKHLSIAETALLVAIPKSPNRLRPDIHPDAARAARNRVLAKLYQGTLITQDQYQRALSEPVQVQRHVHPNQIPHLSWRLRKQSPRQYDFRTTIDLKTQHHLNQILGHYIEKINTHNISNGAIVVIDNETRAVRAVVGSTDYLNKARLGANDGSWAQRSPGSTFKPFLYGLALQQGLVGDQTVLFDVPTNFSGYMPENFSQAFVGPVNLHSALRDSLNVVVVQLYQRLGIQSLHTLLLEGGITTIQKPAQHYGLPLVLGGVEVRLLELTNLYASLANEGVHRPYQVLADTKSAPEQSKRLLSASASWIVTQILTDVQRPDFPASWQFAKNRPTVAWKTGTSYNNRDAWSLGYTRKYTVGVWLGNFDGSSSKELVGSHIAGPLLFDIFQHLEPRSSSPWFQMPAGVQTRKICTLSGLSPNRHCPHVKTEYYVQHTPSVAAKTTELCPIHQIVHTDQGGQTTAKVYEIWPPKVARHLYFKGVRVDQVPPYDLSKIKHEKYYGPRIVSPQPNSTYYRRLDRLSSDEHGIRLAVAVTNRVKKVYWFINDKLISERSPYADILVNPAPGIHYISVLDDAGGTDRLRLNVVDFQPKIGLTPPAHAETRASNK